MTSFQLMRLKIDDFSFALCRTSTVDSDVGKHSSQLSHAAR
jgi:hypothetical protein